MHTLLRSHDERSTRLRVVRYAVLLFAITAAVVVALAVTLDRNASRSNWQQSRTSLAGGAHVGASAFATIRSNLRVQASQLAASLQLQSAIVREDKRAILTIARARQAQVLVGGRRIGALAPIPRIVSTANITDGLHVLARVKVSVPLGMDVLALLRQATPLPTHAALVLVRNGRVIAGGPSGAQSRIINGRVTFGKAQFAAESATLRTANVSVLAVEPVTAIDAISQRYRRFVLLAAAITLALAAVFAARLAGPLARVIGDVAHLTRQVQTDALTNLANRRGLGDRLDAELNRARENGTSVSFVIADIDDFKAVNDGYGHQTGDQIIRAVGEALASSVRELDLPARYGGEEFAVVLPETSCVEAVRFAERIRAAVEGHTFEYDGERFPVTISLGIAILPDPAITDASELIRAADEALYASKKSGRNRATLHKPKA